MLITGEKRNFVSRLISDAAIISAVNSRAMMVLRSLGEYEEDFLELCRLLARVGLPVNAHYEQSWDRAAEVFQTTGTDPQLFGLNHQLLERYCKEARQARQDHRKFMRRT